MKEILPIKEDFALGDEMLNLITGGAIGSETGCEPNECSINTGNCGVNKCKNNSKDCTENVCSINVICSSNTPPPSCPNNKTPGTP